MNVSLVSMLPRALAAPEYRLPDYWRWFDGANRGSGPMWAEYRARDLIAEVPRMPVPMLLIAGASDWNTPVPLVRVWFETVEAPLASGWSLRRVGPCAVPDRDKSLRGNGAWLCGRGDRGTAEWRTIFGVSLTGLAAVTPPGHAPRPSAPGQAGGLGHWRCASAST